MAWQAVYEAVICTLFGLILDKRVVDPEDTLKIEEEKEIMKKSLLILSAIMVLVAFAVPAFAMEMYDPDQRLAKLAEEKAAPLKVTGEFTFGFISSFDSDTSSVGFANAYIDLIWYPDEYNSVLMEIALTKEYSQSPLIGGGVATFPYFQLETDIGAYFGLPVGLVNTMGLTSQYTNKYEVTGHAWERDMIRTAIDPLAWKFKVDFGMAQLTTMIGIGETTNADRPWNTPESQLDPADPLYVEEEKGAYNDLGFYLFVPAVGPAEIEAWYMAKNDPDLKGRVGASAKADGLVGGLLGVAGGFVYDLRDGTSANNTPASPSTDKYWAWAVGVGIDYVGLALGAGIEGNDAATADRLWVDADYAFGGDFGVYATLALSLSDDAGAVSAETYLGSEFGVYVHVGGAKLTVGYLYDADDADGYNYAYAVADNRYAPEGGVFIVGDIDF